MQHSNVEANVAKSNLQPGHR